MNMRVALAGAALGCSFFAAAGLVTRTQPVTGIGTLILSVATPYLPALALVAAIFAHQARRTILATASVATLVVALAIQLPWYYLGRPDNTGQHIEVRILSSNLRLGRADPISLIRLARTHADVITVSELTAEAIEGFRAAGIDTDFPESRLVAAPGAGGIGIWSRYPLTALPDHKSDDVVATAARLHVPGVSEDPVVVSMHVYSPVASGANTVKRWAHGLLEARQRLYGIADSVGSAAVIVGGDFNSTPDVRQFRDLLTNGYRDAVEQTGSGFSPTFPADMPFPPLITIDHVLTRNASARSVRTFTVDGSDHRAILVGVAVPTLSAKA